VKRQAVVFVAFEVTKDSLGDEALADLCGYVLSTLNEPLEDDPEGHRLPIEYKGCKARIFGPGEDPDVGAVLAVIPGGKDGS